jgi:CTP:phosphocholine cytidylyltransferase-like protein
MFMFDKNCYYSSADSEYILLFLEADRISKENVEYFYDSKVTECIKEMGWEKLKKKSQ